MSEKQIVLVGGGARSGKSRFALALARKLGERRLFIATGQSHDGQSHDAELEERIRRHRQSRGADFHTLEEPIVLADTLRVISRADVVVVDCLTLWLSNLLLAGKPAEAIDKCVRELGAVLERRTFHAILVTNEVGMGIVPESALGRQFRDIAGAAHQYVSALADEVYFAVLGAMLRLKPAPAFIPIPGSDA